jgi:hypothetical protein
MPDDADLFRVVHALAIRGVVGALPSGSEGLLDAGLVCACADGYTLTHAGHRHHRGLLERERATVDLEQLGLIYARIPALARRLHALRAHWDSTAGVNRAPVVAGLSRVVDDLELIVLRSATIVPRLGAYIPRLAAAKQWMLGDGCDLALTSADGSIQSIWAELQEDYLQTLGCGYEPGESLSSGNPTTPGRASG